MEMGNSQICVGSGYGKGSPVVRIEAQKVDWNLPVEDAIDDTQSFSMTRAMLPADYWINRAF